MPTEDDRRSPEIEEEQELKQANERWAAALSQKDRTALDSIMADDFTLAFPFEGDDKEQFIADVISGNVQVDSLEGRDVTFRVFDTTGVVFGSETANWHYRGRDLSGPYRFVRVYTKRAGRWQIVTLHLCSPYRH